MNDLERFRILFRQYDLIFDGVHINRAISVELWEFANHRMMFGIHTILKFLFTYKNVSKIKVDYPILATGGISKRKDYVELYKSVLSKVDKEIEVNWCDKLGSGICCHPIMILNIFLQSYKLLKKTDLDVIERICITVSAVYYCNIILELKKCDFSKVKKYICLVDALRVENVITQYMKKIGVQTYSLEEGIFYIFKGKVPHDAVHYEVLTTDHLLCWSQYVIDEYKSYGVDEKKLSLAGYPKHFELKKMKRLGDMKRCMLLLARDGFDDANFKLLDILSELTNQYSFIIKLHPSCNIERYNTYAKSHKMSIVDKSVTISECLNQENIEWAVSVNTTAYYEALMRGIPCLRFEDESFQLPFGWSDIFSNMDDLITKINILKEMDDVKYQEEIDAVLKYVMGIGIDNYREIILS